MGDTTTEVDARAEFRHHMRTLVREHPVTKLATWLADRILAAIERRGGSDVQ